MANRRLFARLSASLVLALATALSPSLLGEGSLPNEARFRHLGTEQGLSHDVVYGLVQDRRGFLWVGTEDGLDRYDGYEVVHYGEPEGLPGEDVSCLTLGRDGSIWIGTWGQGVARLDPVTGSITQFATEGPKGLTDGRIHAIHEASDATVWIGTYSGLTRMSSDGEVISRLLATPGGDDALSDDRVWSIAESSDGTIWLGTNRGLDRLDPSTGNVRSYFHDPSKPDGLSDDLARVVFIDERGTLWIGTGNGLDRFNSETDSFTVFKGTPEDRRSLSNNVVTAIVEDMNGALWIGTFDGGLNQLDPATGLVNRYEPDIQDRTSISHSNIRALLLDRSGVLWAGTRGGGLNAVDLKPQKFTEMRFGTHSGDLPRREVLSVIGTHDGSIWVGMLGALVRYAPDGSRTVLTREPSSPIRLTYDSISSFAEADDGTLWIGTVEGLDVLAPHAETVVSHVADPSDETKLPDNSIEALMFDREGRLWVGTRGGLCHWDASTRTFTTVIERLGDAREPIWVRSLLEGGDGRIWIATEVSGILRLDVKTGEVDQWSTQASEPLIDSDRVFAIERDGRGTLWAGTTGGLSRFDPKANRFVPVESVRMRERSAAIYSIRADSMGHLWLGTPNGLLRYDVDRGAVRTYDESDGLYSRGFSRGASTVTPDGLFLFGAKDGLVKFRPAEMKDITDPPQVELSSMTINGVTDHAASAKGNVSLPPGRYDIAFRFAAFDYTNPRSNRYQYRLAGFDEEWIDDDGRPETTYRGLPPGRYAFHVRASNSDDVWSNDHQLIALTIEPPFWATFWFRALALLVLVALVWWFLRRRTEALRRRSEELESLVSQRTAELEEANSVLARLASTDGLTGLANHRTFQEQLAAEWRRAIRARKPLSLLMVDVDLFKPFNDVYGHQEGDECLRAVGREIADLARRAGDTAARYGGEEFAVLLPDTPVDAALSVAESLRQAVFALAVPHKASPFERVTVSVGVASIVPSGESEPRDLVESADTALYEAKHRGRNRVFSHVNETVDA